MPARQLPTSFQVLKPLVLGGTLRATGATVAASLVASSLGKRVDEYVSRGYLLPNVSQYNRTNRRLGSNPPRVMPDFHLSPTELRAMLIGP